MNEISVRQAMKYMKRLGVKNGDIVAIQQGTPLANEDNINQIVKALEASGRTACIVVVVASMDDLSVLDAGKMMQRGWVNMEKVRALGNKRTHAKKAVSQ